MAGAGEALAEVGLEQCLWEAFVVPAVQHLLCSSCSPPFPPCGWGPGDLVEVAVAGDLVMVAVVEVELVPAASSSANQPVSPETSFQMSCLEPVALPLEEEGLCASSSLTSQTPQRCCSGRGMDPA